MLSTEAQTGGRERQSAEGRRILRLLDRDYPIAYEPGGRPYYADHHADFSVSHSRNMVVAAWLSGEDQAAGGLRVGCDIQYVDRRKRHGAISRRFFFPAEQDYIESAAGDAEGIRRFYRLWVLKEAALKMRGRSVFEMKKAPSFSIGVTRSGAAGNTAPDCFLYELAGESGEWYLLAVAREGDHSGASAEPEFRWFSESTLAVTSIADIYAAQSPVNTVTPKM